VQDLFIETLDPKNASHYMTPDGSKPFETRTETIHVKDAPDVTLKIRATRHGPVLSDIDPKLVALAGKGKVMALAFTALGPKDTTSEALMRLNRAKNWDEFLAALQLYQAPPQNIVYADTADHIGFINPGVVPIRKQGNGTVPADGASGDYDWTDTIPFGQLPQLYDPESGYIFNANNQIAGASYPYFMGVDWEEPYRAQRLQQFFDKPGKQTLDMSAAMQADHVSLAAKQLLPYLLAQKPEDTRQADALKMLHGWDGTMDKSRAEPLIFEAWLYEMHRLLLAEKTGSPLEEKGPYDAEAINTILSTNAPDWCDKSGCDKTVLNALNAALDLLTRRDGADMLRWRWGNEHITQLRHKLYSHIPILKNISRLDIPSSGDYYTLDRGGGRTEPDTPFARTHGGGFRGIYDLGNPAQSRFMITTGESGHIFSQHYGDLVSSWNDVKSFTLTGTHDELTARGLPELVLEPR
jgi:penicillin amidase